jgi:hypothetical protein
MQAGVKSSLPGSQLPSWSGGVAEGRGGCLSNPKSEIPNPKSADWCTSPHVSKGESLTASNEIQNLKSKIGLSLGIQAGFLREFSVEIPPEIIKTLL